MTYQDIISEPASAPNNDSSKDFDTIKAQYMTPGKRSFTEYNQMSLNKN